MMEYVYQSRQNNATVLYAVVVDETNRTVGYFTERDDAQVCADASYFHPFKGFQKAHVVTVDIPDFRPTIRQDYNQ